MKTSKVDMDLAKVDRACNAVGAVTEGMQGFVGRYTAVTTKRTFYRFVRVGGVGEHDVPLPNTIMTHIKEQGVLSDGAFFYLVDVVFTTGVDPQQIAEGVARGEVSSTHYPARTPREITDVLGPYILKDMQYIVKHRECRENYLRAVGEGPKPRFYVVVATNNIYEGVIQAQAAAHQGADIIAMICTMGLNLINYVSYGAMAEGFGDICATQEDSRIMRKALDRANEERGKYMRLCSYYSGFRIPEIVIMDAFEGLDVMLDDTLYGILFRDISIQCMIIDQYTSHVISGFAGVIISTGENNYFTAADAIEQIHMVFVSNFINELFTLRVTLSEEQMGLEHASGMNPMTKGGFLSGLVQAQMTHEIFPKAPLKCMPPTKFMTGNIFRGHMQNAPFNIISIWTYQGLRLLGISTETIHTPFTSNRFLSIKNARYIFNNMRSVGDEVEFKEGGIIQGCAHEILDKTLDLLKEIKGEELLTTLSKGIFADIKHPLDRGYGLNGVRPKNEHYYNPTLGLMKNRRIQGRL